MVVSCCVADELRRWYDKCRQISWQTNESRGEEKVRTKMRRVATNNSWGMLVEELPAGQVGSKNSAPRTPTAAIRSRRLDPWRRIFPWRDLFQPREHGICG